MCQRDGQVLFLPAGDNSAESTLGHVQNTMRRIGNIGRMATKNTERRNVEALAGAALLRNAGFHSVLAALQSFRVAGSKGMLKAGPREAFNMKKCKWLF